MEQYLRNNISFHMAAADAHKLLAGSYPPENNLHIMHIDSMRYHQSVAANEQRRLSELIAKQSQRTKLALAKIGSLVAKEESPCLN